MNPKLIRILEIIKTSNNLIRETLRLAQRNVPASGMRLAHSGQRSGAAPQY